MVWKEPIRAVAARYGLSDRGLAKACMRLHVKVPGRGFWQRKAAGKELWRPRLPTLPPTAPPQERQITVSTEARHTTAAAPASAAGRQALLEKTPNHLIRVAPTLVDPHPLVERTAKSLGHAQASERGVSMAGAKHVLDVRVTQKSLGRALCILDALLKASEARGYVINCTGAGQKRTTVKVLDEEIGFYLEETTRRVERKQKRDPIAELSPYYMRPLPVYDYIATGELVLRITDDDFLGARRQWRDGQRQRLEKILNRFIVGLVAVAEAKKVERQRREELNRRIEERRRVEAEQQRLRWEEEKRIRLLKEDLEAWNRSREIREYVAAMGTEAGPGCKSDEHRRELDQWLQWVVGYADRLDPAVRATPPRDPWSRNA